MSNVIRFPLGSTLRHNLAEAQERKAETDRQQSVVYHIYTEDKREAVGPLIRRYFPCATLYTATGIWHGETERALVIEIVADANALQSIVFLVGDIKAVLEQSAVLLAWWPANSLLV